MINSQKKQKVILISLYERASLGIRAIFSSLKSKGVNTSIISFKDLVSNKINPPTEIEIRKFIELLKELNPTIVGISIRSSYFKLAVSLTQRIKKETGALIVWGGTHPTICPEDCIKYADVVCRGDGEHPMAEIVKKIEAGKSIDKVITGSLNQNLNMLPVYDENNEYVIENDTIQRGIAIKGQTKYVIMATRGCPFNCTFCNNHTLKRLYKSVRRRSVDSVIKELEQVKKLFNLRTILFFDELFVTDKEWLKEFIERYKKNIDLPFDVQLHPNCIREDITAILKQGGLKDVFVGIQSGSERILNIYKRPTPKDSILKIHEILMRHKIKTTYHIILDNPLEDDSDKRETLDLLLEFKRPFLLNIFSLIHFPKTELTELLLKKGMIKREDIEDISAKTFTNYKVRFDTGDLFWNALISLVPHPVPKSIIRYMSYSRFLRKHPKPLVVIASVFRIIRVIELATGMLIRSELNILTIKQRIKSIRNIT